MGVSKSISPLEEWFDCIVLVALEPGADAASAGLAADLAGPLPLIQCDAPGDNPAPLKAILAARSLKRPLLLVAGRGDSRLLVDWDLPFKVYLASDRNSDAAAQLCDLIYASSADTAGLAAEQSAKVSIGDATQLARDVAILVNAGIAQDKKLNILILYCDIFTKIETIYEHLRSFSLHSKHNYFYFPVSNTPEGYNFYESYKDWPVAWEFSVFDAIVWHYVVPAYQDGRLSAQVAEQLAAFDGLKLLFVQDEYDHTATTSAWMKRVGIDVMFTCVPPQSWEYVYPSAQHPGVDFVQTLTGYVPEDRGLDRYALPMAERDLRIAYRGRALPYRYGSLAREKHVIGTQMKALAEAHSVKADIAVDENSRIYGADWYRFLGSARATLATESGSNVFDFDGSLTAVGEAAEQSGESFQDFHARVLGTIDGIVQMNQVSPKIFEAIRMRTALICFEGGYSGVIKPGLHYISLNKDFSNVEDVFAQLEDVPALEAMTTRAFDDVIGSDAYSYAAFAREFDSVVDARIARPARCELMSAPILRRRRGDSRFQSIPRPTPLEYVLNTGIMRAPLQREQVRDTMALAREQENTLRRLHTGSPPTDARVVHRYGPEAVVCYEVWSNAGASLAMIEGGARVTTPPAAWHYAAGVHVDFTGVNFGWELAWVRIVLDDVQGEFRVSLYDADEDKLHEEAVVAGPCQHEVFIRAASPSRRLLLFRTGLFEASAAATVIEVQVLKAPAYPPEILQAARALADLPRDLLDSWADQDA